ncbi:restriction endonuclease subunit S [uncultured Desulfosarcina sp.]|uniref:restriction endonuclease subunit S n=1 Tax=uncultured Desulfosarcina sp. TaxID=218289 RepID=UPI0029C80226|nr:restriction endonuclease subunit S [uncultured Desulfosarcina sp.]
MEESKQPSNNALPSSWQIETLGDITSRIGSGITPSGGNEVYKDEGVIFIRSQNVTNSGLNLSDVVYIDDNTHRSMLRSEVLPFDVLLNITGASIGRCCYVPEGIEKANQNQHVCTIRLSNPNLHDSEFLAAILSSPIGQTQISRSNAGGNREGLNYQQIRNFQIPWPTSQERLLISQSIKICENLVNQTEATIAKLRQVKAGMLHDLLTRGLDENGELRDPIRHPEQFKDSPLGKLPAEWDVVTLGKVADVSSGVTLGNNLQGSGTIELPYLRVANVQDGYLDLSEVKKIRILKKDIDRFSLKKGDVLMNEGGDYDKLGRGAVWEAQIDPCLHQNHVFRVRPMSDVLDSYFLDAISGSEYGKRYFLLSSKQSTNLASINSTQLNQFIVPCPPMVEQKAIMAKLAAQDHTIREEIVYLEKLKSLKQGLMHDLLTGKVRVPKKLLEAPP